MNNYVRMYDVSILDDIHNFFPAFLYDQARFTNMPDVFAYVNQQMDNHFNIFNRAQREYNQRNVRVSTAPSIPIPLSRTPLRRAGSIDMLPGGTMSELFASIMELSTLAPTQQVMEPVIVRPTPAQITQATTLHTSIISENETNCSICQEAYAVGQTIRTINHCSHKFHKECVDTWFGRNVHCPDCRYDIRGS